MPFDQLFNQDEQAPYKDLIGLDVQCGGVVSGDCGAGHSGPVYASAFSPDKSFLVSVSEDYTGALIHCHAQPSLLAARLWSLYTYTNVVVYRGHNYPIWDVAFRSAVAHLSLR